MGNLFTQSTVDREKLDPNVLAIELKLAFEAYYKDKKNNLERKKLDISSLKNRAGIKKDSIPRSSSNVISALYSNVG